MLTFALRCHIAELWCPRPSSLKLQETKDDRSFVQVSNILRHSTPLLPEAIRLWRLLREVHLQTFPPESIKRKRTAYASTALTASFKPLFPCTYRVWAWFLTQSPFTLHYAAAPLHPRAVYGSILARFIAHAGPRRHPTYTRL